MVWGENNGRKEKRERGKWERMRRQRKKPREAQSEERRGDGGESSAWTSSLGFLWRRRKRRRSEGVRERGRVSGRGSAGVVPPDLDQGPLVFFPSLVLAPLVVISRKGRLPLRSPSSFLLPLCLQFSINWSLSFCLFSVVLINPTFGSQIYQFSVLLFFNSNIWCMPVAHKRLKVTTEPATLLPLTSCNH